MKQYKRSSYIFSCFFKPTCPVPEVLPYPFFTKVHFACQTNSKERYFSKILKYRYIISPVSKGRHYMCLQRLRRKSSSHHSLAIILSFWLECCYHLHKRLAFFSCFLLSRHNWHQTQNMLLAFIGKQRIFMLKYIVSFTKPRKRRCSASSNHVFSVAGVATYLFSTSSLAMQTFDCRPTYISQSLAPVSTSSSF